MSSQKSDLSNCFVGAASEFLLIYLGASIVKADAPFFYIVVTKVFLLKSSTYIPKE